MVSHLKELGYRVLCIDRNADSGHGFVWNHIPWGAEDFTGALPLQERVDLFPDVQFFYWIIQRFIVAGMGDQNTRDFNQWIYITKQ